MPLLIDQVKPFLTASLSFSIPASRGLKFGKVALFYLGEPRIEEFSCARAQQLGKLLNQVIGPLNFLIDLTEPGQHLLFLNPEFFRTTKKKEGRLSWSCKGRRLR
jgi:hypothetical protein